MGDKWSLFQKFLITENVDIDINEFILNSVIIVVISYILQWTYQKCAKNLSNKKMFSSNFLLLTFTTMVIITIVKSSLALSLGLVGALSIVRFRAAIKEPEELSYLFFAISMGLGLGANQRLVVIVAFVILMIIVWGRKFLGKNENYQNLFLTVSTSPKIVNYREIHDLVKRRFQKFELKRLDEDEDHLEAAFLLDIKESDNFISFKEDLHKINSAIRVAFIDNKS